MSSIHKVNYFNQTNKIAKTRNNQERSVPKFLKKMFYILEENRHNELVSWSDDGSALIIKKPTDFANRVLPLYFKHSNFSSFIRQLNMYKFKKSKSSHYDHIYTHPMFQRGKIDLLRTIHRKTSLTIETQSFKLDDEIDVDRLIQENMHYKRIHKELSTQVEFIGNKMRDIKTEISKLHNEQKETQANEKFLKNILKSLTKVYGFENIAKVIENDAEDDSQSLLIESNLQEDCFDLYSNTNNGRLSQLSGSNFEEDESPEKYSQASPEYQLSEQFSTNDTPQPIEKNEIIFKQDDSFAGQPLFLLDFGLNNNFDNDNLDQPLSSPKNSRNNSYVIWVEELKNKDYNSELLFRDSNNLFIEDLNIGDFSRIKSQTFSEKYFCSY
jgi:hypothetical protein